MLFCGVPATSVTNNDARQSTCFLVNGDHVFKGKKGRKNGFGRTDPSV